jgi:hypothetical protein
VRASQWYAGDTSAQFGGQFLLVLTFTIQQGNEGALSSGRCPDSLTREPTSNSEVESGKFWYSFGTEAAFEAAMELMDA